MPVQHWMTEPIEVRVRTPPLFVFPESFQAKFTTFGGMYLFKRRELVLAIDVKVHILKRSGKWHEVWDPVSARMVMKVWSADRKFLERWREASQKTVYDWSEGSE